MPQGGRLLVFLLLFLLLFLLFSLLLFLLVSLLLFLLLFERHLTLPLSESHFTLLLFESHLTLFFSLPPRVASFRGHLACSGTSPARGASVDVGSWHASQWRTLLFEGIFLFLARKRKMPCKVHVYLGHCHDNGGNVRKPMGIIGERCVSRNKLNALISRDESLMTRHEVLRQAQFSHDSSDERINHHSSDERINLHSSPSLEQSCVSESFVSESFVSLVCFLYVSCVSCVSFMCLFYISSMSLLCVLCVSCVSCVSRPRSCGVNLNHLGVRVVQNE